MTDYGDIRTFARTVSYYGKTFSVIVWEPENGNPFVKEVDIEGLPTFFDPLDGKTFGNVDDAHDAGCRFATSQIDF